MRRAVLNLRDDRPAWALPDLAERRIQDAFPADWEVIAVMAPVSGRGDGGGASGEAIEAVRGAEVYFGLGLPREIFLAATTPPDAALRWVHTGTAGVASLLYPELVASAVVLTNSAGVHGPPMAETVMGAILHFARGLDFAVRGQATRSWEKAPFEEDRASVREVAGATLGLVGLGGVGRSIAALARALGMRVEAVRRTASPAPEGVSVLRGSNALERLLGRADYVVICAPLTRETAGMIGVREIGAMKQDAVLINVGRGELVDEAALAAALGEGALRGAALDVFRIEPLPAASPLWDLPNVLITPHVSATSPRFWERETALIIDNVERYLAGDPLRNVVDTAAGY